jgi:hypothetical protein
LNIINGNWRMVRFVNVGVAKAMNLLIQVYSLEVLCVSVLMVTMYVICDARALSKMPRPI